MNQVPFAEHTCMRLGRYRECRTFDDGRHVGASGNGRYVRRHDVSSRDWLYY